MSMKNNLKYFVIIIGLFVLSSCMSPDNRAVKKNYNRAIKTYSEDSKIYKSLESILLWEATYKTDEFIKAYIDEYVRRYKLSDDKKSVLVEKIGKTGTEYNEFFIAVFTPDNRWNDLDTSGSVWKLYLEDDKGNRLEPISIDKHRDDNNYYADFFPYLDPWSIGYTVKFPKMTLGGDVISLDDSSFVKLIITGAKGSTWLKWKAPAK